MRGSFVGREGKCPTDLHIALEAVRPSSGQHLAHGDPRCSTAHRNCRQRLKAIRHILVSSAETRRTVNSSLDTNCHRKIDMGYGLSILDMVYRYGFLPYRNGHPGHRYGIWAHDMGDDSIDTVIPHTDMGYLVNLAPPRHHLQQAQSRPTDAHRERRVRAVVTHVEVERNLSKQFSMFWLQGLRSRRFQNKFDRVNLHRPTALLAAARRIPSVAPHVAIDNEA